MNAEALPLAVRSFDRDARGRVVAERWCAATNKRPNANRARTWCGYWVTLPCGFERRWPTCPECLAITGGGEANA